MCKCKHGIQILALHRNLPILCSSDSQNPLVEWNLTGTPIYQTGNSGTARADVKQLPAKARTPASVWDGNRDATRQTRAVKVVATPLRHTYTSSPVDFNSNALIALNAGCFYSKSLLFHTPSYGINVPKLVHAINNRFRTPYVVSPSQDTVTQPFLSTLSGQLQYLYKWAGISDSCLNPWRRLLYKPTGNLSKTIDSCQVRNLLKATPLWHTYTSSLVDFNSNCFCVSKCRLPLFKIASVLYSKLRHLWA